MVLNTLLVTTSTAQRRDADTAWPAYMLPTVTAAALTGISLSILLCRRVKMIICLPLPLRFFSINNVDPEVLRTIFSYPIVAEIVRHADSRRDAMAFSLINREAFHARFLNSHLQSLYFKNVEQVGRFCSYCEEVKAAEQVAGNDEATQGILLRRLGQLASIHTLSLKFSDILSARQSLPLFRYFAGITSLNIEIEKGTAPDSLIYLDSLFEILQPLTLQHLSIVFSDYLRRSIRIAGLPASLWQLTSLETLRLRNLVNTDTFPDDMGQLQALRVLQIESMALRALPNTIEKLKNLETLKLFNLDNLTALSAGIGQLPVLTSLELAYLTRLASLPDSLAGLKKLNHLQLIGLSSLKMLPEHIGELEALRDLRLIGLPCLKALPEQIGKLGALRYLELNSLLSLTDLPQGLWKLENLHKLILSGMPKLAVISDDIHGLTALTSLRIGIVQIHSLPENLWQLPNLRKLRLYSMRKPGAISAGIQALQTLTSLKLRILPSIHALPYELFCLPNLEKLELTGIGLSELSEDIDHLHALKSLTLRRLPSLSKLPAGLGELTHLQRLVLDKIPLTSIPEEIGQLQALTSLELREIDEVQSLPDSLSRLTNLTEIRLYDMDFDLNVPEALQDRVKAE